MMMIIILRSSLYLLLQTNWMLYGSSYHHLFHGLFAVMQIRLPAHFLLTLINNHKNQNKLIGK